MNNVIRVNFANIQPDFKQINEDAMSYAEDILFHWLPDGKMKGEEFIVRNPTRIDKKSGSFCFNVHSGKWSDFAECGDKGIGLISYTNTFLSLIAW